MVGAAIATAVALLCGHLNGFIILKYFYNFAVSPFSYNYFHILTVMVGLGLLSYFSTNLIINNLLAFIVLSMTGVSIFRKEISYLIKKLTSRANDAR